MPIGTRQGARENIEFLSCFLDLPHIECFVSQSAFPNYPIFKEFLDYFWRNVYTYTIITRGHMSTNQPIDSRKKNVLLTFLNSSDKPPTDRTRDQASNLLFDSDVPEGEAKAAPSSSRNAAPPVEVMG